MGGAQAPCCFVCFLLPAFPHLPTLVPHRLQACEDQLGEAILAYAKDHSKPGTVCSLQSDLRLLKEPDGRPSMESDAVVFAGNDVAYIASHKLHITGPK